MLRVEVSLSLFVTLQHRGAPIPVPRIAVASFRLDLVNGVAFDAVSARKDRTIRPDFIEASPQRRSQGIINHSLITIFASFAKSGYFRPFDPAHAGVDGALDFRRLAFKPHQEEEQAGAFSPAQ